MTSKPKVSLATFCVKTVMYTQVSRTLNGSSQPVGRGPLAKPLSPKTLQSRYWILFVVKLLRIVLLHPVGVFLRSAGLDEVVGPTKQATDKPGSCSL